MNGWSKSIMIGVAIIIIAAWIGWISHGQVANSKEFVTKTELKEHKCANDKIVDQFNDKMVNIDSDIRILRDQFNALLFHLAIPNPHPPNHEQDME